MEDNGEACYRHVRKEIAKGAGEIFEGRKGEEENKMHIIITIVPVFVFLRVSFNFTLNCRPKEIPDPCSRGYSPMFGAEIFINKTRLG